MKSSKNVNTLDSEYSMKIPQLNNRDNFRLDRIIDDYQNKITKMARKIIPERKDNKNNEDFFREKMQRTAQKRKHISKGSIKITESIADNAVEKNDEKEHSQMKKMNKGSSKFMQGMPHIKTKDGFFDDNRKSKINLQLISKEEEKSKSKDKQTKLIMPNINKNDKNTFFLTGASQNKKGSEKKNFFGRRELIVNSEEDSDLYSEDEKYFNTQINRTKFESEFQRRSKEKEAKLLRSNEKKNFNFYQNNNETFLNQDNYEFFHSVSNVKSIDYLQRLRNKDDFFKNAKLRKTLKNLEEIKPKKREKMFDKGNYTSTMKNFIKAVNTEVECYSNTLTDIEKGIKNFDHIQSVHVNISPDKIKDKKMMHTDKFVRKYFIYGKSGGTFISEDKHNDKIIEQSDNLAKIRPENSFKFKKLIMDKFSEELTVTEKMLKSTELQAKEFQKKTKVVKSIVGETEKLKQRIVNDLDRFIYKIND